MPTIKFKLKDPKYCNGCKFMIFDEEHCVVECFFKLWKTDCVCSIDIDVTRPQSCIDKFGE
jgi:hypothetical protein